MTDKKSLRQEYLAKRKALDADYVKAATRECNQWLAYALPKKGKVAGYIPIHGEMDITPTMNHIAEHGGAKLFVPVVEKKDGSMIFREWEPWLVTEKDAFGIEVPQAKDYAVPPPALDVMLVPLIAFDEEGWRIGYGKGYYDRAIAAQRHANKHVKIIGVGYSVQQVKKITHERFDEKLDAIITENGVREFS